MTFNVMHEPTWLRYVEVWKNNRGPSIDLKLVGFLLQDAAKRKQPGLRYLIPFMLCVYGIGSY